MIGWPDVVAIEADVLPAERVPLTRIVTDGDDEIKSSVSGSVSSWAGAKLGRAASIDYSAAKPLYYLFKGGMSPTKATRQNRAWTLNALPRHHA